MNDTEQSQAPKKKGTSFLALPLVLLIAIAWALVAIPGSYVGGKDSLKEGRTHRNHGWPLVHLESTTIEATGVFEGGKLLPHKTLTDEQYIDLAAKRAETRNDDIEGESSMLNLTPKVKEGEELTTFWTNADSWPITRPKTKNVWKIPGLIGNVFLLGLVCFIVTNLVNRCRK